MISMCLFSLCFGAAELWEGLELNFLLLCHTASDLFPPRLLEAAASTNSPWFPSFQHNLSLHPRWKTLSTLKNILLIINRCFRLSFHPPCTLSVSVPVSAESIYLSIRISKCSGSPLSLPYIFQPSDTNLTCVGDNKEIWQICLHWRDTERRVWHYLVPNVDA